MERSVLGRFCLSACFKFGTHDDLKAPGRAEIKYELAWVAPPLWQDIVVSFYRAVDLLNVFESKVNASTFDSNLSSSSSRCRPVSVRCSAALQVYVTTCWASHCARAHATVQYCRCNSVTVVSSAPHKQQETQLMLTNPCDAFRSQSRSPNMVPFHMLGMVSISVL